MWGMSSVEGDSDRPLSQLGDRSLKSAAYTARGAGASDVSDYLWQRHGGVSGCSVPRRGRL